MMRYLCLYSDINEYCILFFHNTIFILKFNLYMKKNRFCIESEKHFYALTTFNRYNFYLIMAISIPLVSMTNVSNKGIGCNAPSTFGAECKAENCKYQSSCQNGYVEIKCLKDGKEKGIKFIFDDKMKRRLDLFTGYIQKNLNIKDKNQVIQKLRALKFVNNYREYTKNASIIEQHFKNLSVVEIYNIEEFSRNLTK